MRWGDFANWHVISSRIVAVDPKGHIIEVIARAPEQTRGRAHVFTFKVMGHDAPAPDLEADTDLLVEARPSPIMSIAWYPVPPRK